MLDMWKCVALQELRGPYRPHSAGRPPKPRRLPRSRTPVICLPKCTHTHASDHRREAGPQATLPQHNMASRQTVMSAGIRLTCRLTASLHRWPSSSAAQCSRWPRAPGFSLVFPFISLSCPIQGAYSLAYSLRIRLYTPVRGARSRRFSICLTVHHGKGTTGHPWSEKSGHTSPGRGRSSRMRRLQEASCLLLVAQR
jgi:hypothetical protein